MGFQKGHPTFLSKETYKRMALERKGKKLPKEWIRHISEGKIGKKYPNRSGINHHWYGRDCSGEKNPTWKGDKVGYRGLHIWIESKLGRPDTCEFCGRSGLFGRHIQWANKNHKYKRELTDWIRLCASCHAKYDGNRGRKRIPQLVLS